MMIENDKKATEPHVASCKPEMQINPMGDKEDLQVVKHYNKYKYNRNII